MTLAIRFDNSYARLPPRMFAALPPTPVKAPALIALNHALARDLGLDPVALSSPDGIAMLAGNLVPPGALPLAQAYAGHQFGHWNPQLGDGRAILLGEVVTPDNRRLDLQLKGSGRTPFSRSGDGRAWLGPVLREYLCSEAMAALGVPTTRALAAVATGERVIREDVLPGAVLTRVAASHIRVGTFQYFAARGDSEALQHLVAHVIARHTPEADGPLAMFDLICRAQARLIARWMALGFIHGVMNTDNCAVSGETIDYGPCAFMDTYHPATVFSSIDHGGRYAYQNQPQIALWNLAQLATALIPLAPDREAAITAYTAVLDRFSDHYATAWLAAFGAKLGLAAPTAEDRPLIEGLLALMARDGADFTNTFARLGTPAARDEFIDRAAFDTWDRHWQARDPDKSLMAQHNPQIIPRTHRIEQSIAAALAGDLAPFHRLLAAVTDPFTPIPDLMAPPADDERVTRTFCGT
jgi:uncharacterized protein YdiU (UPF0061 family)